MSATEIAPVGVPTASAPAAERTESAPGGGTARSATGRAPAARRRRWPVVLSVLLVLLPAGLAAGISAQQPPTYAAVADILYEGDVSGSSESIERQLATQQVLLTNRSAIDAAAEQGGRSPEDLLDAVSVEIVEGSNVLRVRVEHGNRTGAVDLAQSLVDRYVAVVAERVSARREQQSKVVDQQISGLTERLVAIAARVGAIAAIADPPPTLVAEQRGLEEEAKVLRQQVADLQEKVLASDVEDLQAGVGRAEVLSPPTALDQPVAPQPTRAGAGGALVGLALAFALLTSTRQRRARFGPEAGVARP